MAQPQPKPPVVTIMGHVDHGKTTLLDKIRRSNVADKEAGGITQHIGAYQIEYQGKPITFIDTPGHAAFSKMRSQGASVTDIIILVVAADDGVKPQTKESIKHIKAAGVPLIVAINKIDVQGASPDMVKAQLTEDEIFVEGYGGSVPVVEISARAGTNIDKLLETILLLAEVENLSHDPEAPLSAVVIESAMQKNIGPVATILVKSGTLKVGMELTSISQEVEVAGKAKQLTNSLGVQLPLATTSMPVRILGLKTVPPVGTLITETTQKDVAKALIHGESNLSASEIQLKPFEVNPNAEVIKVILLADTVGSLEAIRQSMSDEIQLIRASTGQVTESDVMLAQTTKAVIIAFNTQIARPAARLAEIEKVIIRRYTIIYKLLEDIEQQVMKLLEPTFDEVELGVAKVKQLFEIRGEQVAGCVITTGKLTIGNQVHLKRNERIIADARVVSLKQGKIEAKSIAAQDECGLVLKPRLNMQVDDYIVAFEKKGYDD